jgi:hypothetical protein
MIRDDDTKTGCLTGESLYERLATESRSVQRVGLRESLRCLDPELGQRARARDAVREVRRLADEHRTSGTCMERDRAEIIRAEAMDAAYQLRMDDPSVALASA